MVSESSCGIKTEKYEITSINCFKMNLTPTNVPSRDGLENAPSRSQPKYKRNYGIKRALDFNRGE